ncbi:MAG: cytochrome c oxidase subunit 3 [Planctomycetota bacterium]
MSAIDAHPAQGQPHSHDADHGHGHPPHLAHHFDTPEQQFGSAKIGMWVFLATEILMFGGLFCAYAVYRYNNPDVFKYSEHHLNTWLGATNTAVLLASSLTMALAVRAAQLGQQTYLKLMLIMTLFGAFGFMCIKAVEYTEKFAKGYVPGIQNKYSASDAGTYATPFAAFAKDKRGPAAITYSADDYGDKEGGESKAAGHEGKDGHEHGAEDKASDKSGDYAARLGPGYIDPNANRADAALVRADVARSSAAVGISGGHSDDHGVEYVDLNAKERGNVNAFFSIYFMMTGLHAVHVLVGMGLIFHILIKSWRGVFGPGYYTPVDLTGLYWHVVDLIWIFLFPLLYLIH